MEATSKTDNSMNQSVSVSDVMGCRSQDYFPIPIHAISPIICVFENKPHSHVPLYPGPTYIFFCRDMNNRIIKNPPENNADI